MLCNVYSQTADFVADTTKGCVPMQVSFTDLSSGTPVDWEWDMGDGSTPIYLQHPTYVYNHSGTFTVKLTVTYADSTKQTKTISNYINASTGPYVNFSSIHTAICQHGSITFIDTIIPGGAAIKNLLWDFGDGGTSTLSNPVYTFHTAGLYKVSLTAYNQMGCATKTEKSSYITVYPKPKADFIADSLFCIQNSNETKSTTFTNLSSGHVSSFWHFDDGTTSNSNSPNKTFGIGDHDVSLIVTSDKGCKDTLTKQDYISVYVFHADFTASDTIVCDTHTKITFNASNGIQYAWRFGDGSNSIGMKTEHIYTQSGKYTVTLMATNSLGCKDTLVKTNYISVYDSIPPVIVIRDTLHCDTNAIITFKNRTVYASSDNRGLGQTVWDVRGDSSVLLRGDTVTYTYGQYGTWGVNAYIVTPYGCKLPVAIDTVKIALFNPFVTIDRFPGGCAPLPINASLWDEYFSIRYAKWKWGNGDSTLVYGDTASYTYHDSGVFEVEAIATSTQGCVGKDTETLMIGFKPLCSFTSTPTQACKSQFRMPVVAYDSLDNFGNLIGDAPANAWFWSRNGRDITLNMGNYNEISFNDTGSITTANLVCAHYYCLSDTVTKTIQAYVCPPNARIDSISYPYMSKKYDPSIHPNCNVFPTLPNNINGSTGANLFRWNFGNDFDSTAIGGPNFKGDTSTAKNPVYQYKYGPYLKKKDGKVYIRLIAINDNTTIYNACGYCEDTVHAMILISYADMKLVTTDRDSILIKDICQDDTVYFWDSSFCTASLTTWGLRIVDSVSLDWAIANNKPLDSVSLLDTIIVPHKSYYDSINIERNSIRRNVPVYFPDYGVYYAYLYNADTIHCGRWKEKLDTFIIEKYYDTLDLRMDTLRFVVYPRSVPACLIPSPVCARDTVIFTDLSYSPPPFEYLKIKNYLWSSGGHNDTSAMPKFVYSGGGKYDVALTVVNEKDCDSSMLFVDAISVYQISARFSKSTDEVCNKQLVSFRNNTATTPTISTLKYHWDFNGKDSSHSRNTSYVFDVDTSQWVYITLTVMDSIKGCTSKYKDSVYVRCIHADFNSSDNRAACPELQCYFYDQSSKDSIVSWQWDFGDTKSEANTSALKNPSHNYAYAGTYDVRLIINDFIGCNDTLIKEAYVQVNGPYGDFNVYPQSGCYPLTVDFSCDFTNVDTLMIITGDGNTLISDSLTKDFKFTYQNPGPYIPSMRLIKWVTDPNTGALIRCVQNFYYYDTIWAIQINSDFLTDSVYCQNQSVIFKNLTDTFNGSIYPPELFNECLFFWFYGNGDWDSLLFDGATQYDTSGLFDVTLRATIKGCTKDTVKTIKVFAFPDIKINFTDTAACDSVSVIFTADSLTGEEISFDWSFQDGETFNTNPVERLFTSSGKYTYQLKVAFINPKCVKIYNDSINIHAWIPPSAEFMIQNPSGEDITDREDIGIKAQDAATFIDQSLPNDGQIIRWVWDFGDQNIDTVFTNENRTHQYSTTSGIVTVKFHIIDEFGCESEIEHFLLIFEALRFPNIFSPNNDGFNDYFYPLEVSGFFLDFEMIIYNRWGGIVWTRKCKNENCPDYQKADFWWNGKTTSGKDASEGVYYWVVTAVPKSKFTKFILNGSVTLVR